ncbi:hypothetical protein NDU88_001236 [Pleurodeles waltl]|uniref:Uncharacterized protein n=1 Tax=Pleurodeles waltl TaxID=8319 RepID=A0AAV7SCE2_PLEWA|nr:hypothetical protein NDU88_001236 [Pleurodeles waltl]
MRACAPALATSRLPWDLVMYSNLQQTVNEARREEIQAEGQRLDRPQTSKGGHGYSIKETLQGQVFPTCTSASRSHQEATAAAGVTTEVRKGSERGVSDPCWARVLDGDGKASPYLRLRAATVEEIPKPFDVLRPERKEEDRAAAETEPDPLGDPLKTEADSARRHGGARAGTRGGITRPSKGAGERLHPRITLRVPPPPDSCFTKTTTRERKILDWPWGRPAGQSGSTEGKQSKPGHPQVSGALSLTAQGVEISPSLPGRDPDSTPASHWYLNQTPAAWAGGFGDTSS